LYFYGTYPSIIIIIIFVDYFIILLQKPRNTLENTNTFKILQFSTIIGDQKEWRCTALSIITHRISTLRVIKIIF